MYRLGGTETAKIKGRDVQFNYLDAPLNGRTGSRSNRKSNGMTSMQESATNLCSSFSNNNLRGFPRAAFNCWVTEKEKEFLRYSPPTLLSQGSHFSGVEENDYFVLIQKYDEIIQIVFQEDIILHRKKFGIIVEIFLSN